MSNITVKVLIDDREVEAIILSPREALEFFLVPALGAIDDSESSWSLQETNPARFSELSRRTTDLYEEVLKELTNV